VSDAQTDVEALRREVERLRAAADATERRLRATHAVARVLGEETTVATAMPRILGALAHALGCTFAGYWVPDGDALAASSTWRADGTPATWDEASRQHRFERGVGLPGRVWRDRGPSWITEVADDTNLPRQGLLLELGVRAGIGFPLTAGTELLGVVELFMRTPEPPDDQLVEVLRTIGGHLGQFILSERRQAQLRREAEDRLHMVRELDIERDTLAKLDDIARRLAGTLDQQSLVQAVSDVATQVTGAQLGCFFYVVDPDHPMGWVVSGTARDAFARFPVPRNTQLFDPVFSGRGPLRVDDVTLDARYGRNPPHQGVPQGHPTVKSFLGVPVISRTGQVLGALLFGHEQAGVFTERSQRLAVGLAAHAAIAMDNARLFAEQQRLIKELEKANIELDQFAYAASHDLRAPLRGMTNLASWIEEDLGPGTPKKVREHVALLKSRAARMDKLITGLLELARVGRTRQRPERVDVTELLHETIDLLSPPETSRVLIVGAMPTMVAERFALQQVFLNLIANAIQHSGRSNVVVRISCEERADDYEFAVADNGIGIPVEHHERVWQIFQTLSSRDVVESTGIGLTIVKKQVEANAGTAWIDPAVRDGAVVRFTWPKRAR